MKCEKCDKEFANDNSYHQHMHDKHGVPMPSGAREERLEKKKEERRHEAMEKKKGGRMKHVALIVVIVLIFAAAALFVASTPSGRTAGYDVSGFPNYPIHWHADVDVVICGEDKQLPEATPGGLLGTHMLHTHDRSANINSLRNSDGNGVIHTEGDVKGAPEEHTLQAFMKNIGVRFDNQTIMDKKNGDLCGDAPGMVKVFLNDKTLENFIDYLPRNGDFIRIEFSSDTQTQAAPAPISPANASPSNATNSTA